MKKIICILVVGLLSNCINQNNITDYEIETISLFKQQEKQEDEKNIYLIAQLITCETAQKFTNEKIKASKEIRFEMQDIITVVLNRVDCEKHFKKQTTIEEVIFAKNQFEPVSRGIIYNTIPTEEAIRITTINYYKWKEEGKTYSNLPKNALFFAHHKIKPSKVCKGLKEVQSERYYNNRGLHKFYNIN